MSRRPARKKAPPPTKDVAGVLAAAARTYGQALRRQHVASAKLHRALSRGKDGAALDRAHSDACDALNAAEHELLICAAVVGGWSRRAARRSV